MQGHGSLTFDLDVSTGAITARYQPDAAAVPLDLDDVKHALAQRGWGQDVLDTPAANAFCQAANAAAEPVEAVIGELLDATHYLSVAPDGMAVSLTLEAARGGKRVTLEQLQLALAELNVTAGIDETALARVVAAGVCENVPVAFGVEAEPSQPTRFESLRDDLIRRQPTSDDDDDTPVDYRNLGSLLLVTPGTPLMRKSPAVRGAEGKNVHGEAVPSEAVADEPFAGDMAGVALDENDRCLLRAAISGVPKWQAHGASVSAMIQVAAVDLSSGNIDFDGSLQVTGDIKAGMSVKVTGDIAVRGTIEAAHVEAGGSVSVGGGIIGSVDAFSATASAQGAKSAHIVCGGSLKARFIDNAVVNAGVHVHVLGEIRQSDVAAGEAIEAGPLGSQQGAITGGRCRALHRIRAGTLGAPAGTATLLQVGVHPRASERKAELELARAQAKEEQSKVEKLLGFFRQHPEKGAGGVEDRVRETYAGILAKLRGMDEAQATLAAELDQAGNAVIEASRRFCGGVDLRLGTATYTVIETRPGGKARNADSRVVID
jgi:uncharacterized protein (DUF342 family)